MRQIYLIGFMGVGKSAVGRQLAKDMHLPLTDTDRAMVERYGCPIAAMFERWGEEGFRQRETEMLQKISGGAPAVISCGGGVALRRENVDCMKAGGTVVWLTATPETILTRVGRDDKRPLLRGKKNTRDISLLLEQRIPYYQAAADMTVPTDGRSVQDICGEIEQNILCP